MIIVEKWPSVYVTMCFIPWSNLGVRVHRRHFKASKLLFNKAYKKERLACS
jgi:hypothetical protein